MATRHKWKHDHQRPRTRHCTVCGLAEIVSTYTYLSPRNGYQRGYKRRWYKKGHDVITYKGWRGPVPLPCNLVSIALPEGE